MRGPWLPPVPSPSPCLPVSPSPGHARGFRHIPLRHPTTALLLLLLLLLAACAGPTPTPSSTPLPTVHLRIATAPAGRARLERWLSRYREEHPQVEAEVLPMSSARAEEALAKGIVDLALLDQPPAALYRGVLTATAVATEPIAIVVHPGNRLRDLSAVAIAELFSGRVSDWSQVGGDVGPVQVYLPPDSSDEVRAFAARAMAGRRLAPGAIVRPSAESVARAVAADAGGIGLLPAGVATPEVVVLRVDGALPPDEGYPWQLRYYLARGPASSPEARSFVLFVQALP